MPDWLSLRTVGGLVVAAALVSVSLYVDEWLEGPPKRPPAPDPDTVRVAEILRDTVTEIETRLRTVRVAETTKVTERDTIRIEVPTEDSAGVEVPWRPYGLIDRHPVEVAGTRFTLQYYNLPEQRWEERVYEAETAAPDRWALWPGARLRTTPQGLQATAEAHLRWRQVVVSGGYAFAEGQRGVTAGVAWRPVSVSW